MDDHIRRRKLLKRNTLTALLYQICTITCGFILPRLILKSFGSEVNGLVNSITQFLGVISFLELGVGSVVQSALYKPLAERDKAQVSRIMASAQKFFGRLAAILFGYVLLLMALYPLLASNSFGFVYTATLIGAISISSFAQYYFGVTNQLLLNADQRGYINYLTQTGTLLLNTAACAVLIHLGGSIHAVKLTTSLIYLIRPFMLNLYVHQHYSIDHKIVYQGEPITQKWNGIAQHVAAVILDGTDYIVLTALADFSVVSIYSVYHLVTNGIKQMLLSMTKGIQSLLGELWARQELDTLRQTFSWTDWLLHTSTALIFGITGILLVPFVRVYTSGITDTNYIQPLFALLLVTATAGHCLRLPYNLMILACGHYRQTQSNHIIAAGMNLLISIVTVKWLGLVGVAIGTLAAMLYQTVWMAYYNSKNLIFWPFRCFVKQLAVDCGTAIVMWLVTKPLSLTAISYVAWIVLAVEVSLISIVICAVFNAIFYKDKMVQLICAARDRLKRGKK